uniref:Uncharacterized protein n=1 Tax=Leersia perrieri TaxID=77586 RepID=A0A0D9WHL7_9ORYZ
MAEPPTPRLPAVDPPPPRAAPSPLSGPDAIRPPLSGRLHRGLQRLICLHLGLLRRIRFDRGLLQRIRLHRGRRRGYASTEVAGGRSVSSDVVVCGSLAVVGSSSSEVASVGSAWTAMLILKKSRNEICKFLFQGLQKSQFQCPTHGKDGGQDKDMEDRSDRSIPFPVHQTPAPIPSPCPNPSRCRASSPFAAAAGSLLIDGVDSSAPCDENKKKRTLEALQQRYAAAKAKKLQEEHPKSQTKNNDNTPKPKFDASRKGKASEFTPSQTSAQLPSKKGAETNPVYSELSFAPHDNLLLGSISDLDSTDVVHNVVYDIIQKGGDAGKITKGAKKLKLEKGILLDNYVHRGPRLVDAQAKSLLIHSKRSKRHMSLKQHKKCGSFDLPETLRKKKLLSENLLSADLHGALVIGDYKLKRTCIFNYFVVADIILYGFVVSTVAECKSASYQGVCGIMIRETAETFGLISEDNRFRVVPKAGSVFILQADCWKVTLIGDKLSPREKLKENQRQQRQVYYKYGSAI